MVIRSADRPDVEKVDRGTEAELGPGEHSEGTEAGQSVNGVVLRFGGARYALDMAAVAEVVPVPVITRLPGVPPWLSGVVNWRGRVLPVVDLRPLAGATQGPLPTSARLVVLTHDEHEVGVLADFVPGLLEATGDVVDAMPATVAAGIASLVSGIVDHEGPVALLDAAAIVRLRQQLPSARAGRG
jgi:twitching motility protein PilI